MSRVKHGALTERIIGAAMVVLNELRPGLDERAYENALVIELGERGHRVDQQNRYPVRYRGRDVGVLIPDLIVDRTVVVDTKVVSAFTSNHIAQMLGYLNITGLNVALLVSFKNAKLNWKRIIS